MGMLKHLRTLFCLTILLYLTAQISFANSRFTLNGGYKMSKIQIKDDNNLLENLKDQLALQKISDVDGSAQDSNSKTRNENSTYNLVYGKRFHQTLLAENLHGAIHLYDYLDSSLLPKLNDPIFRFSKLFFTNYLLVDYMLTMNHELGHGYRSLIHI